VFTKLLIANRGEIAVRIMRTCKELGVGSVAIYSDVDAAARHVVLADVAVHLPGSDPTSTYLNAEAIITAALTTGAEAIHPGYGFLAESARFARAVGDAGLVWVGPPPDAIAALGDKISARRIAADAGVPMVPGLLDPVGGATEIISFANEYGYPIAIKASAGGGGRGLKIARSPDEVAGSFAAAQREARAYFGSDAVYVERYLQAPKHLEVQILGKSPGDVLWLGVRDCSLQRRHQKLIEESPPPRWEERANDMGSAAVTLAGASGYVNAGTVEMLIDEDGEFYFLEVNSRLQVEHTVTEEVYGIDLVACQLQIAAGSELALTQEKLKPRGHAIECRVNAEDPARGFLPAPGRLTRFDLPAGPGVRVDAGYVEGDEIPGAYDSLIAKVVCWGRDRAEAVRRMRRALTEFRVEGVATTIPALVLLLDNADFAQGRHTTTTLESAAVEALLANLSPQEGTHIVPQPATRLWNPAMVASIDVQARSTGQVVAPIQGTIINVNVAEGELVESGDPLLLLEAMKMETIVTAPFAGRVTAVNVSPGSTVDAGQILVVVE
jgi:acetyl-CoA/propionyl-CoA carboxylase, biotin carboxylase, biotin carboxyl carrier protein